MGFPILAVSERLGHEKVQTTLELYGHLYPDVHGNVAQQLQESAGEYSGRFYTPIPEIGNRRSDVKETALPF